MTPINALCVFLSISPFAVAISVQEAVAQQQQLSTFNSVVERFPNVLNNLTQGGTLFAPSNDAISHYMSTSGLGNNVSALPENTVRNLISYHILTTSLHSDELSQEGGLLANTTLRDSQLSNLQGDPQVVFASAHGSTGLQNAANTTQVFSGAGTVANITTPDIQFENGFVHVVDSVFNLPRTVTKTANASSLYGLWTVLQRSNISSFFDTTAKITCWAPSDEAFQRAGIDPSSLTQQQAMETIKYHNIIGEVGYSSALENGQQYQTVLGPPVTVSKKNGTLYINNVAVSRGNIVMSNGVTQVLDGVLEPPQGYSVAPNPSSSGTTLLVRKGLAISWIITLFWILL